MVAGAKCEVDSPQNRIQRGDQTNHRAASLQSFKIAAVQQGIAGDANKRAAMQNHLVHNLGFNRFQTTLAIARTDILHGIAKAVFNPALNINHLQAESFGKLTGKARTIRLDITRHNQIKIAKNRQISSHNCANLDAIRPTAAAVHQRNECWRPAWSARDGCCGRSAWCEG